MKTILLILGTRPEAIKLAPVAMALRKEAALRALVCNTGQQRELSAQALSFFGITANFSLDVMRPNQSLAETQSRILASLAGLYAGERVDATIVQGDTMTAFCGALASFYARVPVFHVEAGLRSYDLTEPFPEEALRQMISRVASLHFAPTAQAREWLLKEGIDGAKVIVTGNTVIDALACLPVDVLVEAERQLAAMGVALGGSLVLVTAHRRENHGDRLGRILGAITVLAREFPDHQFVVPVHPNPHVHGAVHAALDGLPNAVLTEPLDYPGMVCLMKAAKLVLTDSGGVQEEAPTFGAPILVLRYETERPEGVAAGFAKLVGADAPRIVAEARDVLAKPWPDTRILGENPYGDGQAAGRIAKAAMEGLE